MRNELSTIDSRPPRTYQDAPPKPRGALRHPAFAWRILIVALLFGGLGVMAGLLAGLFLGGPRLGALAGVLAGAGFGAIFEAWPLTRAPEN